MQRDKAEKIISGYVKPVYGFALKRCAVMEDAEDLAQEIILRAYRMLLKRDDITDPGKYIWTVAHNALANHYRDAGRTVVGVSVDEMAESLYDGSGELWEDIAERETAAALQREIAYLSRLQRRIVIAYYYENKKQSQIARELSLPVGTVKWHLFEAKKDLKRGMETMRTPGELKFNPVEFTYCGMCGSLGSLGGTENFFRSALSQNITYAVWREPKTVNEIADALGVSPVYVESEAEFLERYGFLTNKGGKYLCNILLDEATNETIQARDNMYGSAAHLFANALFDELLMSGILDDGRIYSGAGNTGERDKNYLLWALIPYAAALSGEKLEEKTVNFEEVATLRADGGYNVCSAAVFAPDVDRKSCFESMSWSGPCWNGNGNMTVWLVDSRWSDKRIDHGYEKDAQRDLLLLSRVENGSLSEEEAAWLIRRGYLMRGEGGLIRQGVWLTEETEAEVVALGDRVKERLWDRLRPLGRGYAALILSRTPAHLRKMQEYQLQGLFQNNGVFVQFCLRELVENGRLLLPREEQKKSLTTLIIRHDN